MILAWALLGGPVVAQPAVYVDDNPAAGVLIKQVLHLYEQQRITEAAARLQKLIDQYPQSVIQTQGDVHTDALHWARRFLGRNPKLLQAYRRLYEHQAKRDLQLALHPKPDVNRLTRLVEQYLLCNAGLEAGLSASALFLEMGRPLDAAGLLDGLKVHPDILSNMPRWHLLQGAAGLYCRDQRRLQIHESSLQRLNSKDALSQLQELKRAFDLKPDAVLSAATVLPKADVPTVSQPFWIRRSPTKPEHLDRPAVAGPIYRRGFDPDEAYILPIARDDKLYINDGLALAAYDRYTGRPLWPKPFVLKLPPSKQPGSFISQSGKQRPQRCTYPNRGRGGSGIFTVIITDVSQIRGSSDLCGSQQRARRLATQRHTTSPQARHHLHAGNPAE